MSTAPRPADYAQASYRDLADNIVECQWFLLRARHNVGDPQPPERLRISALREIAIETALAERAQGGRWPAAVDALTYGATLAQVAAAVDLDADQVAAELNDWVDQQYRLGLLGLDAVNEVRDLLRVRRGKRL